MKIDGDIIQVKIGCMMSHKDKLSKIRNVCRNN